MPRTNKSQFLMVVARWWLSYWVDAISRDESAKVGLYLGFHVAINMAFPLGLPLIRPLIDS